MVDDKSSGMLYSTRDRISVTVLVYAIDPRYSVEVDKTISGSLSRTYVVVSWPMVDVTVLKYSTVPLVTVEVERATPELDPEDD
jgi:hypothetical protein